MENKKLTPPTSDNAFWQKVNALERSVAAVRKAKGKLNPDDCEVGTAEHDAVLEEFMDDIIAAKHAGAMD